MENADRKSILCHELRVIIAFFSMHRSRKLSDSIGKVHPIEMLSINNRRVEVLTTSPRQPPLPIFLTRENSVKMGTIMAQTVTTAIEAYTNKLTVRQNSLAVNIA
jgi:hypothetical protein